MSDRVFLNEPREHRIDPEPDPRRHGPTIMFYQGKEIVRSNEPILAAARWLLDNGIAWPDETIVTYRGATLSMTGKVGTMAKLTVEETKHGSPTFRLRRWRAFPIEEGAPEIAETADPGTILANE